MPRDVRAVLNVHTPQVAFTRTPTTLYSIGTGTWDMQQEREYKGWCAVQTEMNITGFRIDKVVGWEGNANVQPRCIFASPVAAQQQKQDNDSIRALLGQIQNMTVSHE